MKMRLSHIEREERRAEVQRLAAEGHTIADLAKQFKLSQYYVRILTQGLRTAPQPIDPNDQLVEAYYERIMAEIGKRKYQGEDRALQGVGARMLVYRTVLEEHPEWLYAKDVAEGTGLTVAQVIYYLRLMAKEGSMERQKTTYRVKL